MAFLGLQRELRALLRADHGAVHAVTCGCDHRLHGEIERAGECWRWRAHSFGVVCERVTDGLLVDLEPDGGEAAVVDPHRLALHLGGAGAADPGQGAETLAEELASVLAGLAAAGELRRLPPGPLGARRYVVP